MNNQEILEYNKRCVEFLGLVPLNKPYKGAFTTNNGKNIPDSFLQLVHSEMEDESWYVYPKFDSDWNWIMEIYNKLMRLPSLGDKRHPETGPLGIFTNIKYNMPNKEKTVQAINQFLIWYNEQKSKHEVQTD